MGGIWKNLKTHSQSAASVCFKFSITFCKVSTYGSMFCSFLLPPERLRVLYCCCMNSTSSYFFSVATKLRLTSIVVLRAHFKLMEKHFSSQK